MRLIVGILSLLVVAAVVMLLAKQQLQAVGQMGTSAPVAVPAATAPAAPPPTVAEGAKQLQQRVADDVSRALQQGASRASDAE